MKTNNDIKIFGMSNSTILAKKISEKLNIELTKIKKTTFNDGEILISSESTVRNKVVYIICSTTSSDSIMELLLFIDSLKRASAKKIILVNTYYGYSRQDRRASKREPIGAKLIATLFETAGATKVISWDLHNPSIQGFFDIPVDDLKWCYPLTKYIRESDEKLRYTIVSPDHGGAVRARTLAEQINNNIKIAIVDKRRTGPNVSEIVGLLGDVKNKNCIIYDDIIDTGGTIIKAAKYLKEQGAKQIIIAATHGLFSNGFELFQECTWIDKVLISDSIPKVYEIASQYDKLKIVSIADFSAKVINASINSTSISEVYDEYLNIEKK